MCNIINVVATINNIDIMDMWLHFTKLRMRSWSKTFSIVTKKIFFYYLKIFFKGSNSIEFFRDGDSGNSEDITLKYGLFVDLI
jgi:hypothetical protein